MPAVKCTVLNHRVEFAALDGLIRVRVDGDLIGAWQTASHAIFQAAENIRAFENASLRPRFPEETWKAVESIFSGDPQPDAAE
jgi:hypothetical protein